MKKSIITIIALIILGAGGYYLYQKNQAKAPSDDLSGNRQTSNQQTQPPVNDNQATSGAGSTAVPPSNAASAPKGTFSSGEGEPAAPDIQVVEVDFDGAQFTPKSVNIKVNDWVFFKNKSSADVWVASNPHPTHTDYPGFDAKQSIAPGGQFKFQFTKAGSWGYHDHLNPVVGGTVVVK